MNRTELLKTAKPILFNTEMVQAIQDNRKTVTRRVIKPKDGFYVSDYNCKSVLFEYELVPQCCYMKDAPYQVGDILYVRETFYRTYPHKYGVNFYRADGEEIQMPRIYGDTVTYGKPDGLKWHPSIHMPKEAARIFLKVTDVRAEKVQDITEEQAIKEGIGLAMAFNCNNWKPSFYDPDSGGDPNWIGAFAILWNSTIKKQNLEKYGYDTNPWVWVYEFEKLEVEE